MDEQLLRSQTIYHVRHGSVAYGTNTPLSDVDEKGVAVMSGREYYYGTAKFEQKDSGWNDNTDRVVYDIRKFWALASDCNPNIVEVLFVDRNDILKLTPAGDLLLSHRNLFLSQKAAYTFGGYAHSQLKRMEGHHRWLTNPPKEPNVASFTLRYSFGPGECWQRKFAGHEINVFTCILPGSSVSIEHIDHEAFDAAKKDWNNYNSWKANRNPARAAIEAQYGYDCKHAYHLIRLLRMAKEIVAEGKVIVKRPDKDQLLDIRNGKYTYKELLDMAEGEKADVDKALATSPLPAAPDRKALENGLINIIGMCVNSAQLRAYEAYPAYFSLGGSGHF